MQQDDQTPATKEDVALFRQKVAQMEQQLKDLEQKMNEKIAALEKKMYAEITCLRREMSGIQRIQWIDMTVTLPDTRAVRSHG